MADCGIRVQGPYKVQWDSARNLFVFTLNPAESGDSAHANRLMLVEWQWVAGPVRATYGERGQNLVFVHSGAVVGVV